MYQYSRVEENVLEFRVFLVKKKNKYGHLWRSLKVTESKAKGAEIKEFCRPFLENTKHSQGQEAGNTKFKYWDDIFGLKISRKQIRIEIERPRPPSIYLFKCNNWNTKTTYEICSKFIIKTLELRHWRLYNVFIVDIEHISQFILVFLFLSWTCKCDFNIFIKLGNLKLKETSAQMYLCNMKTYMINFSIKTE